MNSLASKSIDYFQQFVGLEYLEKTIGSVTRFIITTSDSIELDPAKIVVKNVNNVNAEKEKILQQNKTRILEIIKKLLNLLEESITNLPSTLKLLYNNLQKMVIKKFPESPEVRYSVVSSFFFLRLVCPALLNPKLFGLYHIHVQNEAKRRLTLVAKIFQSFANLNEFGEKEKWLITLNPFIVENIPRMKKFLDEICVIQDYKETVVQQEIVLSKDLNSLFLTFVENLENLKQIADSEKKQELVNSLETVLNQLSQIHGKAQLLLREKMKEKK